MSAISTHEIEEFLNGALVTWLESCLPRPELLSGYPSLLDGTLIHSVWLQIDPAPQHNPMKLVNLDENVLGNARSKNFDCIVRNLKTIYEEELGQTILLLPDCSILGNSPETRNGLDQMKLLLTLLLGAAVQCPNKQTFINRIKELDVQTQHSIVELIKQVTDSQSLVLTCESLEHLESQQIFSHIIRIARERDKYHSNWIQNLLIEPDLQKSGNSSSIMNSSISVSASSASSSSSSSSTSKMTDNNHLAVELADLKSKLRKNRQELEEKSEAFMELKEELEHKHLQYEKLRVESQEWYAESRRAAAYRDEVDVLRERSERADRLDIEVQRFREKLSDAEFFKTRVEELREDNRTLLETKDMLEEQLLRSRKRSEHTIALETEIIKYKQKLNDIALERDVDKNKLQELLDENTQLQLATRNLYGGGGGLDVDNRMQNSDNEDDCASGDNSLSEQLTNNAQTRALKLELENRRLQQSLDAIKESSFHESANHTLELEKDKKRLLLKVEQLQENILRLQQQNKELENVFKNALEENCKLQMSIDTRKLASEKQLQDRETERLKLIDCETHVETLTKEKQRIQTLCESVQRRADDLERFLDVKTKDFDSLQLKTIEYDSMKNNISNLNDKLITMEKENGNLSKEIVKLRVNLELKDVQLDENVSKIDVQLKDIQKLTKEMERHELNVPKIQELEIRNNELESQTKIHSETIDRLQKDLVDGTIVMEKIKKELEKFGIDTGRKNLDTINLNVENVIENFVKNPETFKTVREIMLNVSKEVHMPSSPLSSSSSSTSFSSPTSNMDSCIFCHHNKRKSYKVEKQIDIIDNSSSGGGGGGGGNNNIDAGGNIDFITEFSENGNNKLHHHKNNIQISIATQQWKEQYEQLLATIAELQQANESLQTENVRHKVDVATASTQIQSLNTQHVALQLANSQLAAEKDGLLKRIELFKQQSDALLHDQVTLQCLHEQLNSEYEGLCKEKEMIKSNVRDLRIENRDLRERELVLIKQIEDLQKLIDAMKKENENFCNLRAEHSKLKDDFRNLFTTSERLKHEYKNVQEQYKSIRSENGNLKLQNTEINGELNARADQMKSFEIEYTKVLNHCEMLQQMNSNLDTDRRSLMDHVSQLLAQYHELLSHSLEDKQHYHDEEKLFTDKVNNLHRQKEKLEEKIMEHYRKLENCSPKKKPFGSSFVKKVKKAGSDIINRVPHRNRRSWMEDARLTQSQFTLGSESGGNESDNSNSEEPNSVASDTNLLQRNSHLRQSLQRRPSPNDKLDVNLLIRGGLRSSVQTSKRGENSTRSIHRHSVHGLESPDVTGSSLTLGTAGSRRTVYLIDDNTKLAENQSQNSTSTATTTTTTSSQTTGTTTATTTTTGSATSSVTTTTTTMGPNKNLQHSSTIQSQNMNNNNNNNNNTSNSTNNNNNNNNNSNTNEDGNNQPPSTFVMYNRISNIIGNVEQNQLSQNNSGLMTTSTTTTTTTGTTSPHLTIGSSANESSKVKDKKRDDKDKETAIWYEYGCV